MELVETRLKGCYHLKAKDQYELTSTLMRIQEFYESSIDGIRGAYFDIEEFMDAYAEEHGTFSYFEDWIGFNLDNRSIRRFFKMFPTRRLTKKEKAFKKLITPLLKSRRKFSIIATYEKTTKPYTTFEHELAHGLYYLEVKYKRKDGTAFWTESLGTKVLTSSNEHIGFLGIFRDITDRKKTEAIIKKQQNEQQQILDTMVDAVISIDEDGSITKR